MQRLILMIVVAALVACSDPRSTELPREIEKMDSIKESMEKLTPEERELVASYIVRHTVGAKMGALFGGKEGPGIPEGMTIRKAIEEERAYRADAALEQARQKALKEKLEAEQAAASKKMREAVTVTLVSKRLAEERGYSGILMDEKLEITFGYKNNTDKDISGVKGRVSIKDLFGDELSAFQISNDETIKAGQSVRWTGSRSVRYAMGNNKDRKLAELPDDKFVVEWHPQVIVFADGAQLSLPE